MRSSYSRFVQRGVGLILLAAVLAGSLFAPGSVQRAYAIAAPELVSPAHDLETTIANYPPLGIPELKWNAVGEATSYQLQVSTNLGFSDIKVDVTTPNLSYTVPDANPFADREYFWRVRVVQPETSPYSPIWRFVVHWATATNKPALTAPANGATLSFFEQTTFSWQHVTGASHYRLEVAASQNGFDTPLNTYTTLTTTYQPTAKLANGSIYYWRVIPRNTAGRDGTPSEVRSFTVDYSFVPLLLEPPDDTYPVFTPSFRWTAVRGAQFYTLQYSTDPTMATNITEIVTRNTSFTPTDPLPNDVNYYWRVRAHSGASVSAWSTIWNFKKQWYIQPVLLTPPNNYQYDSFPFYSWTPVPGASRYKVEISGDVGFTNPRAFETANTFLTPGDFMGGGYWRVTPLDSASNRGKTSETWSNVASWSSVQQIYPLYYYTGTVITMMTPHEDRSAPLPIFQWHRMAEPQRYQIWPDFYRLEVSRDPLFNTIDWQVITENTSAAPTMENLFAPLPNTDYFWRVFLLDDARQQIGHPSEIWKTRIDLSKGLSPTVAAAAPALLRPEHGYEFVEATPLFEWKPVSGAASYEVQIGQEENFAAGYTVITDTVPYPAYAPSVSLAQRSLWHFGFGSFYWRVRALDPGGLPLAGGWSEIRRFQVGGQSQWTTARTPGSPENQLEIASDPLRDQADDNYDLNYLYAAQDAGRWYFSFSEQAGSQDMVYGLYLDQDHVDDSGGWYDPVGYSLTTTPGHRPEYAVYVNQVGGVFSAANVIIYSWNPTLDAWDPPKTLQDVGGGLSTSGSTDNLLSLALYPDGQAWAVGQAGNILHGQGNAWTLIDRLQGQSLYGVEFAGPNEAWAVGDEGRLLHYSGGAWSVDEQISKFRLRSISLADAQNGFAVGDVGTIVPYEDGVWGAAISVGQNDLYAVDAVNDPRTSQLYAVAVGSNGTVLRYINGVWSTLKTGDKTLRDVSVTDSLGAWAVAEGGQIYHWKNNNFVSQTILPGTPQFTTDLYGIAVYSDTTTVKGYAVGAGGVILKWNNGLQRWEIQPQSAPGTLYDAATSNNGTVFKAAGAGGVVYNLVSEVSQPTPVYPLVELAFPNTSIGMQDVEGSYAAVLFSLPVTVTGGLPYDTAPSDPQAGATGYLRFFATTSERLNQRTPPDTVVRNLTPLDPTTWPSVLPYFWDLPVQAPYADAFVKTYLDPGYTTPSNTEGISSAPEMSLVEDILGDNTYYWRVQSRYYPGTYIKGAWSQGSSFKRAGFVPQNLRESVTFATPTFSWSMVEGAEAYELQVDDDPSFGSPAVNIPTAQNSFTPTDMLRNGEYTWRVRALRYQGITNEWSAKRTFTLNLVMPQNLRHAPSGLPNRAPTLCWNPVIQSSAGQPVFAAFRYYVEVARDSTFSVIMDAVITEQACWTPTKGYEDGQYFWHVAVIDGSGNQGEFSPYVTFTKQYPLVTLVSPVDGSSGAGTPTFVWNAVNGAARYRLEVNTDVNWASDKRVEMIDTPNTRYTPLMTYPYGKTYYWRVAIIDQDGKPGPFNDAQVLITQPIAGLAAQSSSPTLLGNTTVFTATVTTGTVDQYTWSFGDGGTASGPTASHRYAAVGTYTAVVTATNSTQAVAAETTVVVYTSSATFVYHDAEDVVHSGEEVYLAGSFNDWNTSELHMTPNGDYSQFSVNVPLSGGVHQYRYVVKSGGDQWNWLNTAHRSMNMTGAITVDDYRTAGVAEARLNGPAALQIELGQGTGTITGTLSIDAVTNGSGAGRSIRAQLGFGTSTTPSNWTWLNAPYLGDSGGYDVFSGSFTPGAVGKYYYAFRYDANWGTGNSSAGWTYGDLNGGVTFDIANAGVADVLAYIYPVTFIYNDLEDVVVAGENIYLAGDFNDWSTALRMTPNEDYSIFQATVDLNRGTHAYWFVVKTGGSDNARWLNTELRSVDVAGTTSLNLYRRVTVGQALLAGPAAITITLGTSSGSILGQAYMQGVTEAAGGGRAVKAQLGYGSSTDPAAWTWKDMSYQGESSSRDVYQAQFTPAAAGIYYYAVRFDPNWGAANPAGGWHYGDLDGGAFEQGKVGVLHAISSANTHPVTFVYHDLEDVVYSGDTVYLVGNFTGSGSDQVAMTPNGDASEFTLTLNLYGGTYAYSYAIGVGSNTYYTWLDSGTRSMTVSAPATRHDYRSMRPDNVVLGGPLSLVVSVDQSTGNITGKVLVNGMTELAGVGRGMNVQVGYGSASADPATWTWVDMTYSGQDGSSDVFSGSFTPTAVGTYRYVIRVNGNWGVGNPNSAWTLGDSTGGDFEMGSAGLLVVNPVIVWDYAVYLPFATR